MKPISDKIRTLRRAKGLTQEQLAEVLFVTAQSVSKWENGLSAPDLTLLPIIARFFGITIDELFGYRLDALNRRERFIRFLADNGMLRFGQFRLKSGRLSPYYVNTSSCRSSGQIAQLGEFYAEYIRETNLDLNLLAGNSAREIPSVIATGMTLHRKYGLDIPISIDSALGKNITEHDSLLLIKDTLTSGASLKSWMNQNIPANVLVSVDRMERGEHPHLSSRHEIEQQYDIHIHAVATLDDIIHALESGVISGSEHLPSLQCYRDQYGGN